jgi:ABC-type polysaccharide/polyol phosphate export permease
MIRIVIENLLLFLLPTILYVIYVAVTRPDNSKGILDGAPLAFLMAAGVALMLIVLAVFVKDTGSKPGQRYVPPSMKDGQIQPGRFE